MAAPGTRRKAYGAYYFRVEIDGKIFGDFRSVSGLKSEAEIQSHGEGGLNTTEHKLIGRTKYNNIVLKWGFAKGELWVKRMLFVNDSGGIQRISGSIIQMGPDGPEHTFRFIKGWICKWEGPDFDATKNEISLESIEIAHEGLIHSGSSSSTRTAKAPTVQSGGGGGGGNVQSVFGQGGAQAGGKSGSSLKPDFSAGLSGATASVDGTFSKNVAGMPVTGTVHADASIGKDGVKANASGSASGKAGPAQVNASGSASASAGKDGVKASADGSAEASVKQKAGPVEVDAGVKAQGHVDEKGAQGSVTGHVDAKAEKKVGPVDVKADVHAEASVDSKNGAKASATGTATAEAGGKTVGATGTVSSDAPPSGQILKPF